MGSSFAWEESSSTEGGRDSSRGTNNFGLKERTEVERGEDGYKRVYASRPRKPR